MIIDPQTNFLYLADTLPLKYPEFHQRFEQLLKRCGISFSILPHTKDVWAADYMPIQVAPDHYVQFVYNPDYLRSTAKWRNTITDTRKVCEAIGISPVLSPVVLDGGNVSRSSDCVILCDKLFTENPAIAEKDLIRQLQDLFEVSKIVLVPSHLFDFTGHSDGVLRWYDRHTVLINDYTNDPTGFGLRLRMALHNAGLSYISIPYNPYRNQSDGDATGEYINFLWMEQAIILPVFGLKEDEQAVRQFEQLFPGKIIETIPASELAANGGVLNCISWNVFQKEKPECYIM